ncbi:MAG: hypothetical protein ACRDKW_07380 [Actinomycetota bacterium]
MTRRVRRDRRTVEGLATILATALPLTPPAPVPTDPLAALVDWVEHRRAPESWPPPRPAPVARR